MAFKEVKQYIDSKVKPELNKGPESELEKDLMKVKYVFLAKKLDKYKLKSSDYIAAKDFADKNGLRFQYLTAVTHETARIIKDKKVLSEEFDNFAGRLNNKSDDFYNKLLDSQRKIEAMKYESLNTQVDLMAVDGGFAEGIDKLQQFSSTLSSVNKTNPETLNANERDLRLDIRIKKKILELKEQKAYYDQVMKKGNYVDYDENPNKKPNFILSKKKGVITLAVCKWENGDFEYSAHRKVNWLDLKKEVKNHPKATIKKRTKTTNKGIIEGKGFAVEVSEEDLKEIGRIGEILMIKKINALYRLKGLEGLPPERVILLKQSLQTNLNKMSHYFQEKDGLIFPTKLLKESSVAIKEQAYIDMLTGSEAIMKIKETEAKIAMTSNPLMKHFYIAEVALARGDHMKAYANYKKFIDLQSSDETKQLTGNHLKTAKAKLKLASMGVLNMAEQYLMMGQDQIDKNQVSKGLKVINDLRKKIKSGKAISVHEALGDKWSDKDVLKIWYRGRSGAKRSRQREISRTNQWKFNNRHMMIIRRLCDASAITDDKSRESKLFAEGQYSRKGVYSSAGGAGALFKGSMGTSLRRHEKRLGEDKSYNKRIQNIRKSIYADQGKLKKDAKKILIAEMGKDKFGKLSPAEKDQKLSMYMKHVAEMKIKVNSEKYLFNRYLKETGGKDSSGAAAYMKMTNHYNSWKPWKWSDRAWSSIAKGVITVGIPIAMAGGASRVVSSLFKVGTKQALTKLVGARLAASAPARYAVVAGAFGTEVAGFEASHRGIRTAGGEKDLFKWGGKGGFKKGMQHTLRTLGMMAIGSKISAPLIQTVAKNKYLARTISVAGVEAPILTWLAMKYDKSQGMSGLQIYAGALRDIAFITGGRKIFDSATKKIVPRGMAKLEIKSKVFDMMGSRDPAKAAQGHALYQSLKKGQLTTQQVQVLASNQLVPDQISQLRRFMREPNNRDFLIYLKAAKEGKKMPSGLREVYEKSMSKLAGLGLNKVNALKFMKAARLDKLLGQRKATKIESGDKDLKDYVEKGEQAKAFLTKNKEQIREWLTNVQNRTVFKAFMLIAKGNFAQFKKQFPELSDKIPQAFLKLGIISLAVISGMLGMPMGLVNLREELQYLTRENKQMSKLQNAADVYGKVHIERSLDRLGIKDPKERELARETFFDQATGLMNRNGLSVMDGLIKRGKNVAVASYDADHFGMFNKVKSEKFGDQVIRIIGMNMNQMIIKLRAQGHDVHGIRMGGEEIVIFGQVKRQVLNKAMGEMHAKIKREINSVLTARDKRKIARRIYKTKYASDKTKTIKDVKAEIGGSTAAIVVVKGTYIKKAKGSAGRIITAADRYMEKLKNHNGRGQIHVDKRSPKSFAESVNKMKMKNELNDRQNAALLKEGKVLDVVVAKDFYNQLKILRKMGLGEKANARLMRALAEPNTSTKQIAILLKKLRYKGDAMSKAQEVKQEYYKAIRDHGTYTGAATKVALQRAIDNPKSGFKKSNILIIEFGEFKSINETLGHKAGDIFLTHMYQNVIKMSIAMKIPKDQFIVSQKGANFVFIIKEAYLKKHPKVKAKIQAKMQKLYKQELKIFIIKINKGKHADLEAGMLLSRQRNQKGINKRSQEKVNYRNYEDIRAEWIRKNKQATVDQSLKDQNKLFFKKSQT